MDVGQPPDYLTGMTLYLDSLKMSSSPLLAKAEDCQDFDLVGPVIIVRSAWSFQRRTAASLSSPEFFFF
jgi:hypothetical protein